MVAKKKPALHRERPNIRAELERLYESSATPEEFIHVLFAFLSELTARDYQHPLVKSLADELARAATQPVTQTIVHDLGNTVMAALNTVDVLGDDVRAVLSGRVSQEHKAKIIADVFAMIDDLRGMMQRSMELVAESRSLNIDTGEPGRTQLSELLVSLTRMMNRSFKNVSVALVEPPSVLVTASKLAIHRVLVNLIQNAVEAVKHRRDGQVVVKAWTTQVDAFVQVSDNGPGIQPLDHDDVFELFYTTKPTGSGMGLFVCRTTVVRWGGYLQLDSKPGEGATFTFSIPRADTP